MAHPVAHFEIITDDPQRAVKFYGELFDWNISADPTTDGYSLVDTGAGETGVTGGIGPSLSPGDTGVKIYVRVDDLEGHVDRAVKLGATLLAEPMDLPGDFGRIAVLADPDDNPFGLWH